MDAVSAASAIAALISLSGAIVAQSYQYISSVRGAPRELRLLISEVAALNELLDQLQNLATVTDGNSVTKVFETFSRSGGITTCTELFKDVETSVHTCIHVNGQNKRNAAKSLLWPFKERETRDTLQKLDRMKSTLNAAVSLDLVSALQRLDDFQKDLSDDLSSIKSNQQRRERQDLFRWLSPTEVNPEENRNIALELKQPDTGRWLLDSTPFKQWKQMKNGLLWLSGNPGSGKTILATTVIEHLEITCASSTTASVYFYCDHKNPAKQPFRSFVTSIISQLIQQSSQGYSDLERLFEKYHKDQSRKPNMSDLLDLLKTLSCHFISTFIVLDALDEVNDVAPYLKGIEDLHDCVSQDSTIRVLVTSRNELSIERSMVKQEALQLQITSKNIQGDLADYIQDQIETRVSDGRLKLRNPQLKEEIISILTANANGMFLWVRLQLDRICSMTSDKLIRKALSELPKGLDTTYIRVLQKIQAEFPDNLHTVKRILTWLVGSTGRLSLWELAEAISIEEDDKRRDIDAVATDPKDLLRLCGCLVNIEDDDIHPYVGLIHLSLEEYLKSPQILESPVAFFHINLKEASLALASTCLQYVGFSDFETPCASDDEVILRLQDYQLLEYASLHWPTHLHRCGQHWNDPKNPVWEVSAWFLKPGFHGNQFSSWQQVRARRDLLFYGDIEYEASNAPGPLYYAILYGLDTFEDWLIQRVVDVNRRFAQGMTPLHIASWVGRENTVRKLLARGAQVDSLSLPKQLTPLHLASTMRRLEVVQLLLAAGANPGKASASYSTPFYRACRGGSLEVVMLLYAVGVNVNACTWDYWSPLHEAIENDHPEVVRQLLYWGADLEVQNLSGLTPLTTAAEMNRSTIYRIIQEHALTERKLGDPKFKMSILQLQEMLDADALEDSEELSDIDEKAVSHQPSQDYVKRVNTMHHEEAVQK